MSSASSVGSRRSRARSSSMSSEFSYNSESSPQLSASAAGHGRISSNKVVGEKVLITGGQHQGKTGVIRNGGFGYFAILVGREVVMKRRPQFEF